MGTRINVAVAQLVAFPEAFIPGYPYWALEFDPMHSNEFIRRLFENAADIPSPITTALCAAAEESSCHAIVGMTLRPLRAP